MLVLDCKRHLVAVFPAWHGCEQIYPQARTIRRKEFEAFRSKQWSKESGQHFDRLRGRDDTVLASEPLQVLPESLEIHRVPRASNSWLGWQTRFAGCFRSSRRDYDSAVIIKLDRI